MTSSRARPPAATGSIQGRPAGASWRALITLVGAAAMAHPALAHEPLFMMSHEAPGKGAFDVHAGLSGTRGTNQEQTALEAELTLGLARDVAAEILLPALVVQQQLNPSGRDTQVAVEDPALTLKWRFWNDNQVGKKYAAAAMVRSTAPITGQPPTVTVGISQGMESLSWYYFVDSRARFAPTSLQQGPGSTLFADMAGGWRPYLHGLDDTDIVVFLETNYEHRYPDQQGGLSMADTGGDFVFVAPEILASPSNRVMFKTGIQIPLLQFPTGAQEAEPLRFVLKTEIRF